MIKKGAALWRVCDLQLRGGDPLRDIPRAAQRSCDRAARRWRGRRKPPPAPTMSEVCFSQCLRFLSGFGLDCNRGSARSSPNASDLSVCLYKNQDSSIENEDHSMILS